MKKRVFIIHGWGGNPEEGWFPWLKKELEAKGFEVRVPAMPDTENPEIETWVSYLAKSVGMPDENTYFVGHSIGCQTILRYLDSLPEDAKVGGVVLVAGWVSLTPMATRTEEEKEIVMPWYKNPIDLQKVKKQSKKITAIFSDNDPFVPLKENSETYKNELGAKIIIENNKGHFSGSDGITELPSALNAVLEISMK